MSYQEAKTSAAVQQPFLQGDKHSDTVSLRESSQEFSENSENLLQTAQTNKKHDKTKK